VETPQTAALDSKGLVALQHQVIRGSVQSVVLVLIWNNTLAKTRDQVCPWSLCSSSASRGCLCCPWSLCWLMARIRLAPSLLLVLVQGKSLFVPVCPSCSCGGTEQDDEIAGAGEHSGEHQEHRPSPINGELDLHKRLLVQSSRTLALTRSVLRLALGMQPYSTF